jgi:putative inorganic carbon (HCO3(-)) transporter
MEVISTAPKPGALNRPQGIILIIVAIVFLWMLLQNILSVMVVLAVTALFIIGLRKPLWAMAALLVAQLTITSYMVATPFFNISLRLLLILVTFLIMGRAFLRREIDLGPGARKIIIPVLVLVIITTISNMINSSGFDFVYKEFRNQLVGLLFIILLPAIIQNSRQLKIICTVAFVVIIASAIIGVLQHYNLFGMQQATLTTDIVSRIGRVPGMSETELEFAYILSVTLMILLGIYLLKGFTTRHEKYFVIAMLILLPGLYFTYTRSALISIVIGFLALVVFARTRIKWPIVFVFAFLVILALELTNVFGGTFLSGRSESSQEESSVARSILWQAVIAVALDNPILGIGGDQFLKISPEYANKIDPELIKFEEDRYYQYRTLGKDAPHNDFLRVWAYYGTPALIVYIWFHFALISSCASTFRKSKNRLIKGLALGLAAALVTYVVNSFYHNVSSTLPIIWILAGFSLVVAKLAAREKTAPVVQEMAPSQQVGETPA